PEQLREINGVAPISLDAITRLGWDQRRRHHNAIVANTLDQPIETVPCRAGLIAERQSSMFAREFCHELACLDFRIVDLAEIANLTVSAGIGNCPRIAQFRRIQRHKRFSMMLHDSPPCVRLYPAYPGNPRHHIEGESPSHGKGHTVYTARAVACRCRRPSQPDSATGRLS